MPKRIQRKRTKGWRMPDGAVYVGRPSKWGNPFRAYQCQCCDYWDVRDDNGVTYLIDHEYARRFPLQRNDKREAQREAVRLYQDDFHWGSNAVTVEEIRESLAGRDLACWCQFDQPCHADVLLELANGSAS